MLLAIYAGAIVLMIVLETALVLFILLGKEKVKELANDGIIALIENYRTFSDLRIIIDLVQTSLSCCGGYESIDDWENNLYFNCSSLGMFIFPIQQWTPLSDPNTILVAAYIVLFLRIKYPIILGGVYCSSLFTHLSLAISACGVPTSCCRKELQINSQCGYYIRSPNDTSRLGNVNNLGCIAAIENIFNHELNIFIGCLAVLFVIEIIVIAIALWLLVDRKKKRNLRVINHTGLEDSNRVRESDWEINSI